MSVLCVQPEMLEFPFTILANLHGISGIFNLVNPLLTALEKCQSWAVYSAGTGRSRLCFECKALI